MPKRRSSDAYGTVGSPADGARRGHSAASSPGHGASAYTGGGHNAHPSNYSNGKYYNQGAYNGRINSARDTAASPFAASTSPISTNLIGKETKGSSDHHSNSKEKRKKGGPLKKLIQTFNRKTHEHAAGSDGFAKSHNRGYHGAPHEQQHPYDESGIKSPPVTPRATLISSSANGSARPNPFLDSPGSTTAADENKEEEEVTAVLPANNQQQQPHTKQSFGKDEFNALPNLVPQQTDHSTLSSNVSKSGTVRVDTQFVGRARTTTVGIGSNGHGGSSSTTAEDTTAWGSSLQTPKMSNGQRRLQDQYEFLKQQQNARRGGGGGTASELTSNESNLSSQFSNMSESFSESSSAHINNNIGKEGGSKLSPFRNIRNSGGGETKHIIPFQIRHRSPGRSTLNNNVMSNFESTKGRGIKDEYQDYNDELSRQLKIAAEQDEREYEERRERKIAFRTEHCGGGGDGGNSDKNGYGSGNGYVGEYVSSGSSNSSREHNHHYLAANRTVDQKPLNTNRNQTSSNGMHVKKKLNQENSTQSTVSASSSSGSAEEGVVSSPQVSQWGYFNADTEHAKGDLGVSTNSAKVHSRCNSSEVQKAFERLNCWPEEEGATRGGRKAVDADAGDMQHESESEGYEVQKRTLSPPPVLGSIKEEPSPDKESRRSSYDRNGFASSDAFGFDFDSNDSEQCEERLNNANARSQFPQHNDHVYSHGTSDDVASIVSYYDDPSIDMMSSIATNDTSSIDQLRRGGISSPTSMMESGSWDKFHRSGNYAGVNLGLARRDRPQQSHDPPGTSIDEIIYQEQSGRGGYARVPSPLQKAEDYCVEDHYKTHGIQHTQRRRQQRSQHLEQLQTDPWYRLRSQQSHEQHQDYPSRRSSHQQADVPPPQLQTPRNGWQWSDAEHRSDQEQHEYDGFDIEFVKSENEDYEASSLGNITGDYDNDGVPPTDHNGGDDDTATNTLDTVDLVAEVKRVWRHVQKYERKKQKKKKLIQQYRNGGANLENVDEEVAEFTSPDDDANHIQRVMHNFNHLNMQDDEVANDHVVRGRAAESPVRGPLDQHIRSTSVHSRTLASPGHSESAMASRASTEKDVNFVSEGVEMFYESQTSHYPHHRIPRTHHHKTRPNSSSTKPQGPVKENSHSHEYSPEPDLSKPYDMTKSKSTGTAFSSKTTKQSNMTSQPSSYSTMHPEVAHQQSSQSQNNNPSNLRSEMARKYTKKYNQRTLNSHSPNRTAENVGTTTTSAYQRHLQERSTRNDQMNRLP
eukprot:g15063.t1 g15063   contig21:468286-472050(+)